MYRHLKTCRRRKKKCDLQRPHCGQCLRGNFTCGGYHRDITFIQHVPCVPVTRSGAGTALQPIARQRPYETDAYQQAAASFELLPQSLSRSAFETKTCELFWEMYLPKSGIVAVNQWAKTVQERSPSNEALRFALRAVSISRIGSNIENKAMIQQGIELYGKALVRLTRALKDIHQINNAELIASCKLLSMFEQSNNALGNQSQQGINWMHHIQGVGRLIELRGPQQYCSENEHILFIDARLTQVIAAAARRKATYLSRPEWDTVPWFNKPKTIRDELVSMIALFPTMFEQFDAMQIGSETFDHKALKSLRDIVTMGWKMDYSLQRWKTRFIHQLYGVLSREEVESMGHAFAYPPERFSLDFSKDHRYEVLYTSVLYWNACLMFYGFLRTAIKTLSAYEPKPTHAELPARTEPKHYAVNVSRSAKHFFEAESGLFSAYAISWPLGTALTYFAGAGKEMKAEHAELLNTLRQSSKMPSHSWIRGFLSNLRDSYKDGLPTFG